MSTGYEISGISIIYLIAIGLQVFILIFLFGKRQIMRFTWGSKKTPNAPLGSGLPKKIKKDVSNSLALVAKMHWEPKLTDYTPDDSPNIYRVKTIDDVQTFFSDITRTNHSIPCLHKITFYKLWHILMEKNYIDNSCKDPILICSKLYEQARYTNDVYPVEKYKQFSEKFSHIVNSFHQKAQSKSSSKDLLLGKDR